MGHNQEAYDAGSAALARALPAAPRRRTTPERVTIFTDAQAAIGRMASDAPGPGQVLSPKSDGVPLTRGSAATRRLTSGQKSLQRSRTPAG